MLDPLVVAPIVIGIVLLFAGATLSRYGIALMGALVGAGGGYLAAPTVASTAGIGTLAASAAGIALGIVVGVIAAHLLLSFAVGMIGFGVGTYVGLTVLAPILVDGAWYVEAGVGVAIGIAVAVAGTIMTHYTMIALTSFLGAALSSRSLTFEHFEQAQEATSLDPILFDAGEPLFLGLLAVGIGLQVGLLKLGYATWFVRRLPGAGMGRDRSEAPAEG
ncbi:phosphate ABC transporter permease [Halovivax gelatinilyticus]|uniref:phosphate ABC transporter permease n=1 Tax=Halovivax gelatinilyticus TaxID=2961597 RepID=UPI0020CA5EF9|nr:phosphate ABC transporter permease [Halovivax gelatinilyticus]